MSGKITAIAIVVFTAIFGVALWYAQTRAFYEPTEMSELVLTAAEGGEIVLGLSDFEGVDAMTSPLRFRGCFTVTEAEAADLLARAAPHPEPVPLIAPAWFDCYDAEQIGADLESGAATGLTAEIEIARGVDRVTAIYPDGRGYTWHQLNGTLE